MDKKYFQLEGKVGAGSRSYVCDMATKKEDFDFSLSSFYYDYVTKKFLKPLTSSD